jgi:hypothetical protein
MKYDMFITFIQFQQLFLKLTIEYGMKDLHVRK